MRFETNQVWNYSIIFNLDEFSTQWFTPSHRPDLLVTRLVGYYQNLMNLFMVCSHYWYLLYYILPLHPKHRSIYVKYDEFLCRLVQPTKLYVLFTDRTRWLVFYVVLSVPNNMELIHGILPISHTKGGSISRYGYISHILTLRPITIEWRILPLLTYFRIWIFPPLNGYIVAFIVSLGPVVVGLN